jgi:glycerophosphoryl diester phosphodiesterase
VIGGGQVSSDGPWLILHRASASAARFDRGLASEADRLEMDVWLENDRAVCRHDPLFRPAWWFLTNWHGWPRPRLRRLWLDALPAPGRTFLDFKDPHQQSVAATLAALRSTGSLEGASASTPIWGHLDRLADLAPEVGRFYSIGRGERGARAWDAYRARVADSRGGHGVSIHHQTATAERLAQIQNWGLRAICYTVNDFDQGVALLDLGAGGLTSDRLDLIARWRVWLESRG